MAAILRWSVDGRADWDGGSQKTEDSRQATRDGHELRRILAR